MQARILATALLLLPATPAVADRVLDDFNLHAQVPASYAAATTPSGLAPSLALVDDPRYGRVLEVRGGFACANLAEAAVGALPDEPDCAEDFFVLRRVLEGPERSAYQGVGAWVRADLGIEFRVRIARVIASPQGPRLRYRELPAYRPAYVDEAGQWFRLGVDWDAEPLQEFEEAWTGAPQPAWHSVEWFAYPTAAAQSASLRLQLPTLLTAREVELAAASIRPPRAQPGSMAERLVLDLGFLNRNTDFQRLDQDLLQIRNLGVRGLRISQEWSATQRAVGGAFDWQPLDALRARLGTEPWRLIVILGLANPWYAEACPLFGVFQGFPPVAGCPAYRQAWREFVAAKTARLATHPGPVHYELWNEPNLVPFWLPAPRPLEYADLARDTLPIVRAQHPGARVLVGSLTHRQGSPKLRADVGYLRRLQAPDLLAAGDGFAWHAYRRLRTPPEQVVDDALLLDEVLRAITPSAPPLYDSEWGYPSTAFDASGNGHAPAARHAQAVYAARRWLSAAALGWPLIKWFNWRDGAHIEAPPGPDAAFDPERNFGLLTWQGQPKPAHQALVTLLQRLREHRLVGIAETHRHDLVLQHWQAAGVRTWVAWYAAPARPDGSWPGGAPVLRVPAGVRVWDSFGLAVLPDAERRLVLDPARGPLYIRERGAEELFWSGFEP